MCNMASISTQGYLGGERDYTHLKGGLPSQSHTVKLVLLGTSSDHFIEIQARTRTLGSGSRNHFGADRKSRGL